jgi:hypothetical protein
MVGPDRADQPDRNAAGALGFPNQRPPSGEPVNIDGKKFARKFGTKSGEFNERETAAMLTKVLRSTLKRGFDRRPDGFDGPIHNPEGFY